MPPRTEHRHNGRFGTACLPWLLPGALLLAWGLAGHIETRPTVLPSPSEVGEALWKLARSGDLFRHLAVSGARALGGLAVGGSLGFVLGVLTGWSRPAERLLDTSVQMLRSIPHLALVPLLILWLGIGEVTKVTLVALGTFFPIYVNTRLGLQTVDAGLVEMARAYGLAGWPLFREVLFPGALPCILTGLRYALGVMWMTLIVAETIAAHSGIGYLAAHAREFMQADVIALSIGLYALLGKLADGLARWLERTLLTWHPSFRAEEPE